MGTHGFQENSDELKTMKKQYEATGHKLNAEGLRQRVALMQSFKMPDLELKAKLMRKFNTLGSQLIEQLKLPRKIKLDEMSTYAHAATAVLPPTIGDRDSEIIEFDQST